MMVQMVLWLVFKISAKSASIQTLHLSIRWLGQGPYYVWAVGKMEHIGQSHTHVTRFFSCYHLLWKRY